MRHAFFFRIRVAILLSTLSIAYLSIVQLTYPFSLAFLDFYNYIPHFTLLSTPEAFWLFCLCSCILRSSFPYFSVLLAESVRPTVLNSTLQYHKSSQGPQHCSKTFFQAVANCSFKKYVFVFIERRPSCLSNYIIFEFESNLGHFIFENWY